MADTKISALAEETSPAGSDVLAISDGSTTKKVTVTNLVSLTSATTSAEGTVELATNAETVTGTDTARVAPISALKHHEGVVKAWVHFDGTSSIDDSYGVTSLTDNGTGDYDVNFSITFANADYVFAGAAAYVTEGYVTQNNGDTKSTTVCQIKVANSGGALVDCDPVVALFIGDTV